MKRWMRSRWAVAAGLMALLALITTTVLLAGKEQLVSEDLLPVAPRQYVGNSALSPHTLLRALPVDEFFIADQGGSLDQRICSTEESLRFPLAISRVFGPVHDAGTEQGYLRDPTAMVANGVIASHGTLYLRVRAEGGPGTDLWLTANGRETGAAIAVPGSEWMTLSVPVPQETLRFPAMARRGSRPEPTANELRLLRNSSGCVEVDWAALHIRGMRPLVLVNGILSNTWAWRKFTPHLDRLGVPYMVQELDATRGIYHNAADLARHLPAIKAAFGVTAINLVAHSKGGLDSRAYMREHDDVDTLVQLATPNRGSECATTPITSLLGATWDLDPEWLHRNFNYRNASAGTDQPPRYLPAWTEKEKAPIYILSGSRFAGHGCPLGIGRPLDPPHDSVVSRDRATLPWNWSGVDGDGIDQGKTDATLPYDHRSIHSADEVVGQVLAWIAATYGLGAEQGSASRAAEPEALPSAMMGPALSGERWVEQTGSRLQAGERVQHEVPIAADRPVQILVVRAHAGTAVRLIGPDGSPLEPVVVAEPAGLLLADLYELPDPESGRYTVEVAAGGQADLYEVQVRTAGGFGLRALPAADTVRAGEQVTVRILVEGEGGAPQAGAEVSAELLAPDGSRRAMAVAPAQEGSFVATVAAGTGGLHVVRVRAQLGGEQRIATAVITVIPASAALKDEVREEPVDANGDGVYESLDLHVSAAVTAPGRFQLSGSLYAQDGTLIQSRAVTREEGEGEASFRLSFAGDALFRAGKPGPYLLKDVVLLDLSRDGLAVDGRAEMHTTRAYQLERFGLRALRLTGGWDRASDQDGDGTADLLVVGLTLHLPEGGTYRYRADLTTGSNRALGSVAGEIPLAAGTQEIQLSFDGDALTRLGRPGPYRVVNLLLEGPGTLVEPVAYITGPDAGDAFILKPAPAPPKEPAAPRDPVLQASFLYQRVQALAADVEREVASRGGLLVKLREAAEKLMPVEADLKAGGSESKAMLGVALTQLQAFERMAAGAAISPDQQERWIRESGAIRVGIDELLQLLGN